MPLSCKIFNPLYILSDTSHPAFQQGVFSKQETEQSHTVGDFYSF